MTPKFAFLLAGALLTVSSSAQSTAFYARETLNVQKLKAEDPSQDETGNWTTGEWSGWSSLCEENASRTRLVTCLLDGNVVEDSNCSSSKPLASEVATQYSGCTSFLQNTEIKPNLRYWAVTGKTSLENHNRSEYVTQILFYSGASIAQTTLMPLEAGKSYRFTLYSQNKYRTGGMDVSITSAGQVLANTNYNTTGTLSLPFRGTGQRVTVTLTSHNDSVIRISSLNLTE